MRVTCASKRESVSAVRRPPLEPSATMSRRVACTTRSEYAMEIPPATVKTAVNTNMTQNQAGTCCDQLLKSGGGLGGGALGGQMTTV